MAEQFNRQQLIIAKATAKNISDEIEHLSDETLSFSRLLADHGLKGADLESFINDAFSELREDMSIALKIVDDRGRLIYSSLRESITAEESEFYGTGKKMQAGKISLYSRFEEGRKIVLVTPIWSSGAFRGVIITQMMLDGLTKKFLAPLKAGIRGNAWMMDDKGTLLYHPSQEGMVGKNLFRTDKSCFGCHKSFDVEKNIIESGDIGYSAYIAPHGEDKLIAFSRAKIGDMTWIVCASIPYSEVTFSIRKSMQLHSLLAISIFLATLGGAFAIVLINRRRVEAEEKARHLESLRKLQMEVVRTKDYLENILESTESKIMVLDTDLSIKTINSAHERLCGINKEELIGKNFFDVFPMESEEYAATFRNLFSVCLRGGSRRLSNYPYRRDEKTLYLNLNLSGFMLHDELAGVIISSSDVTEEVNLKTRLEIYALQLESMVVERTDELKGEKEKLDAIVSAIEGGLFVVNDADGRIIWANRTLLGWMGRTELDGITVADIYGHGSVDRAIVDNRMIREIIHHDFGRKSGWFQITSTPIAAPQGTGQTLVLIQDITDMKKMEERMMHSDKLSALARISAGVAHEIGNPLTSISSYVQILREMDHDDFTRESLETIAKHINRIADIVRQMSGFSRTKESNVKPLDVHSLVNLSLELVKYDKRMKGIRLSVNVPENLPKVRADETQLIQVLLNIILNAADSMSDGGDMNISAAASEEDIEISISDTGPGVPQEIMEKIFDPFFTTKEKGTGLGLSVSYNIVKNYQGDITVENRPEGGAVFRVRLPYHEN